MDAQQAWLEYRDALDTLTPVAIETVEARAPAEAAVDTALARSLDLERALTEDLTKVRERPLEARQLTALKLEAAAVYDLDAANRLLAQEDTGALQIRGEDDAVDRDGLDAILSASTAEFSDIFGLPKQPGRFARATEADPHQSVKDATNACIDNIVASTSDAASTTILAIAAVPGADLAAAIADELEAHVRPVAAAVNWVRERAVTFILRAVNKLLAVFGSSTDRLRDKLQGWLSDADGEKFKRPMHLLYRTDALKGKYGERIDKATSFVPTYDAELTTLATTWGKHMSIVKTVGKLLAAVGGKIRALAPPASEALYLAAFVLASGYVIVGGGDQLDWSESDGPFDLVDGVGAIIDRAIAQAPAAH